jgi:hypothetical protein
VDGSVIPIFHLILWIEVKRPGQVLMSDAQFDFCDEVQAQGHFYLVADSVDVVADWLKDGGL